MLKEQEATLSRFMQHLNDLKRSNATKRAYELWLTKLAAHISKPFEAMEAEDLASYVRTLDAFTPASRNTVRHALRYFFVQYLKRPSAVEHPAMKLEKAPEKVPALLTDEELQRLLGAARSIRDKALIAVLIEGGMRAGALSAFPSSAAAAKEGLGYMSFGDVEKNPHGFTIHIRHTKGGNELRVPIFYYAADLKQWLTLHPSQNDRDPLWCFQRDGQLLPLDYYAIHRIVRLAARRAGIHKRVHPHLLRKQWATTMKEKYNMDSWDIAQQGGWVENSPTMRKYIHQNPDAVAERYAQRLGIREKVKEPEATAVRKECLNCHEVLSPTSKYCPHCGQIQDLETVQLHREQIAEGRRLSEEYRARFEKLESEAAELRKTVKDLQAADSWKAGLLKSVGETVWKDIKRTAPAPYVKAVELLDQFTAEDGTNTETLAALESLAKRVDPELATVLRSVVATTQKHRKHEKASAGAAANPRQGSIHRSCRPARHASTV